MILALLLAIAPTDDLLPGTNAATAALFEALEANDAKAVKKALARKGVDVNARTAREADTPLMLAANLGSVELVKALLAAGADPNKAPHSRYHHAPLFYALMGNKLTRDEKTLEAINGVVKVLLDAKATRTSRWCSPRACRRRRRRWSPPGSIRPPSRSSSRPEAVLR